MRREQPYRERDLARRSTDRLSNAGAATRLSCALLMP